MNEVKASTTKAIALAIIMAVALFFIVLVSSMFTFKGFCVNGRTCSFFEFIIQRLMITLALSWKFIILIATFPYLAHAIKHFRDKLKNKKTE